jgi:hypothetical protein
VLYNSWQVYIVMPAVQCLSCRRLLL